MLYVFHVDDGQMTTYDMNLTLQSVACLKSAIEQRLKVPANLLVLLVSGGDVLEADHLVSSYSAGTDTNPIYMFIKPSVKEGNKIQQSMCNDLSPIVELSLGNQRSERVEGRSVNELRAAVEQCRCLPPAVSTVAACAQLAQQFSDLAHEVARACYHLVHEQHLQYQGWAAVVANLEDIFAEFCERSKNFKESFKKHRLKREEYHEQLVGLNEVLEILNRIPMLTALQLNAEAHKFSAFDIFEDNSFESYYNRISRKLETSSESKPDFGVEAFKLSEEDVFQNKDQSLNKDGLDQQFDDSDEGVTFKAQSSDSKEEPSLLHWILAQGNKASLQDILDYCQKGLALIDAEPLKEREAELCYLLDYANTHGLKQIKGIEDRLYGLDQLLNDVRKLEKDQHDQAASLIQYRERLTVACDPSVLPTLVQSHWCQLEKLLRGHQLLIDIRRRIAKSKEELSHIIKARLEAVLVIENCMCAQDAHGTLSAQCFGRLARYFAVVAQLHRAPAVFARALHEVARRRTFSHHYIQWAVDLATKLSKIHEEEVCRRQEFNSLFDGHFLRSLFPGLTDLPPAFATVAPPPFDDRLPKLTDEDISHFDQMFPEYANEVPRCDMEPITRFFQQRFYYERNDADADVQVDFEKDFMALNDSRHARAQSEPPIQKMDISVACCPDTMAVSTVTESNMDSYKINIERLQQFLVKLCDLCKANILYVREELVKLRTELDGQRDSLNEKCLEILEAWKTNNDLHSSMFREHTQRLTFDHEIELSDIKDIISEKEQNIVSLHKAIEDLKAQHQKHADALNGEHQATKDLLSKTQEKIKALEAKLEEADAIKSRELKELQDKMHLDYKGEIESLRSRFRLVALTNMDRSPSESSLEKIERTDCIEISSHNAIVMQTKENAEVEKEEAVKAAVEKCAAQWQERLDEEIATLKAKFEEKLMATNEASKRLQCERERQLEAAREREAAALREAGKLRDAMQLMAEDAPAQLKKLESERNTLQQQIADLQKQLKKKSEKAEKRKDEDSDGRSPPRHVSNPRGRCHTPCGLAVGTLSLSSCQAGQAVLVMWDPAHQNYVLLQEAPMMFFVHSDCLPALDLSLNVKNENERRLYTVGILESKEYCYAKKTGNRYHMLCGSRFYRVRVRPMKPALASSLSCCEHRTSATDGEQSATSNPSTDEGSKQCEVATGALINLESPASEPSSSLAQASEDQLDSIEATENWYTKLQTSGIISSVTEMECSVGRCREPEERAFATALPIAEVEAEETDGELAVVEELAEEATP